MAKPTTYDTLSERLEAFAPALFVVGLLLFFIPVFEAVVGVYPYRLTNVVWRFGAVGILSTGLGSAPVGLTLLLVASTMKEQRALVRAVSIVSFALAALLIVLAPLFVLDALQVQSRLKAEEQTRVLVSWTFALFKLLCLTTACLVLGLAGWRTSKRKAQAAKRQRSTTPATVVPGLAVQRPDLAAPKTERPVALPARPEEAR